MKFIKKSEIPSARKNKKSKYGDAIKKFIDSGHEAAELDLIVGTATKSYRGYHAAIDRFSKISDIQLALHLRNGKIYIEREDL